VTHKPLPVLEASGLVKRYRRGAGKGLDVTPLYGVDLTLAAGEVVAVVGPSGGGKSTLARCLTLLEQPDEGTVRVGGVDAWSCEPTRLRQLRRRCQLLPQEPGRAVSPRWNVEQVICEPLADPADPVERRARAADLLTQVDLDVPLHRRARDLSGGQLQRLVLARALACEPSVMVLDETLTGLDLSLRARIAERLLALRAERGLALVLISHDVALMGDLADRILRLEAGRLVPWEGGDAP